MTFGLFVLVAFGVCIQMGYCLYRTLKGSDKRLSTPWIIGLFVLTFSGFVVTLIYRNAIPVSIGIITFAIIILVKVSRWEKEEKMELENKEISVRRHVMEEVKDDGTPADGAGR